MKENTVIDFYVDDLSAGKSSVTFKVIVKCQKKQVVSAEMTFVNVGPRNEKQYFDLFEFEIEGFKEAVYNKIKPYYNHDARKYHNIFHINHMLATLNKLHGEGLINSQEEYRELYLAIGYHDAVYVPGAPDNEEVSAELFKSDFHHCRNENFLIKKDRIVNLIQSTSIGFPHEKISQIPNADLLHDLDYMNFTNYEKLQSDTALIMFEYLGDNPSPDQVASFNRSRREFLTRLLDHPVMLSPQFSDLDPLVKDNIRRFLEDYR